MGRYDPTSEFLAKFREKVDAIRASHVDPEPPAPETTRKMRDGKPCAKCGNTKRYLSDNSLTCNGLKNCRRAK